MREIQYGNISILWDWDLIEDRRYITESILEEVSNDELYCHYNTFCKSRGLKDLIIHRMEKFNEYVMVNLDATPLELLSGDVVDINNFNSDDDYFTDTIHGIISGDPCYLISEKYYWDFIDYMSSIIEKDFSYYNIVEK